MLFCFFACDLWCGANVPVCLGARRGRSSSLRQVWQGAGGRRRLADRQRCADVEARTIWHEERKAAETIGGAEACVGMTGGTVAEPPRASDQLLPPRAAGPPALLLSPCLAPSQVRPHFPRPLSPFPLAFHSPSARSPLNMTDDSTLAKLLADALAKADDLQRQLAAADARAAHYERLAQQHETRLRDAADVWQALERTLQHTRSELGRVLPPDVAAASTPTTRAIALSRIPTQATLPPSVPVKAISFPSLPPPPLPNPVCMPRTTSLQLPLTHDTLVSQRNSQLLQTTAPVAVVPVSQTSVARPVATTSAAVLAQRKERARFSNSPPPFAGAAAAESRKRKRDDGL